MRCLADTRCIFRAIERRQICFFQESRNSEETIRSLQWKRSRPDPLCKAAQMLPDINFENRSADTQINAPVSRPTKPEGWRIQSTGALQRLPQVPLAEDHLRSALKRSNRVSGNPKLKNKLQYAKNLAARKLDTLTQELTTPMGKIVKGFPLHTQLHPFEEALLDLTIGIESYNKRLKRMDNLRKTCLEIGKSQAGKASGALSVKEANSILEDGCEKVQKAFKNGATAMDSVKEIAQQLRRLHTVDPRKPSVVLVGAPNVGKSSLVQVLSTGLPEICNYPFTTRTVKMGHFYLDGQKQQVTDTPGVLDRKEEDRNAMERLTLACLQHLVNVVVFVTDLTEGCGTNLQSQWNIRKSLQARFAGSHWIDVFSKADLIDDIEHQEHQKLSAVEYMASLTDALKVSATTQQGITDLQKIVAVKLQDLLATETNQNDIADV